MPWEVRGSIVLGNSCAAGPGVPNKACRRLRAGPGRQVPSGFNENANAEYRRGGVDGQLCRTHAPARRRVHSPPLPRKRLTEPATRRQAKTCSSDRASIWLARRSDPLSAESALEDRGSGSGTPQPNRTCTGARDGRRAAPPGARGVSRRRFTAGFQSCGEVTAVSRNSGTRRTRKEPPGYGRTHRYAGSGP